MFGFGKKKEKSVSQRLTEANSVFGINNLGQTILLAKDTNNTLNLLYPTIADTTRSGIQVDVSYCLRNEVIVAGENLKLRAFAQMKPRIRYFNKDTGAYEDPFLSSKCTEKERKKADEVQKLLKKPNNYQSSYEFLAQISLWLGLTGEAFILNWRNNQDDVASTPDELYVLDSTLITTSVNSSRYPSYLLSTPITAFQRNSAKTTAGLVNYAGGQQLPDSAMCHLIESPWQGSSGFNKLIQISELVALSQGLTEAANFVVANSSKPSGLFVSDQEIPDSLWVKYKQRLAEQWNSLMGSRDADASKPGQAMMLDKGLKYMTIEQPSFLSDANNKLKDQVDAKIAAVMGIPPFLLGVKTDMKFNNTQTARDEFYRSNIYPLLQMTAQKLSMSLFKAYPNLMIDWDTSEFLKGQVLEQMQYAVGGIKGSLLTVNEARQYMGLPKLPGMDTIQFLPQEEPDGDEGPTFDSTSDVDSDDALSSGGQDTGGGGGGSKVTRLPFKARTA